MIEQISAKKKSYTQTDYECLCMQTLSYVQVNLFHFFNQKVELGLEDEQSTIQQMMGALAFIPEYSRQKYQK